MSEKAIQNYHKYCVIDEGSTTVISAATTTTPDLQKLLETLKEKMSADPALMFECYV